MEEKPIVVFYSWQSDLPDENNRRFIREALHLAAIELGQDLSTPGLRVDIDEATRDIPGSPNIPHTILQKIRQADVFVADITTINPKREGTSRAVPNPNVAIELGYAIGELGWSRIILLFNTAFGNVSEAPFDLDRQRISPFSCPKGIGSAATSLKDRKAQRATYQTSAVNLLSTALGLIIKKAPPRPSAADSIAPEVRKRSRDIEALNELLGTIHLPTMDDFLTSLPEGRIPHDIFHYWEGFRAVFESSLFHLHNRSVAKRARDLFDAWRASLNFGEWFAPIPNFRHYVFHTQGDIFESEAQKRAWRDLQRCGRKTSTALRSLLDIVRRDFVEVDIQERSRYAFKGFVELRRGIEEQFADSDDEVLSASKVDASPKSKSRSKSK